MLATVDLHVAIEGTLQVGADEFVENLVCPEVQLCKKACCWLGAEGKKPDGRDDQD
jgi:hypothetical protein